MFWKKAPQHENMPHEEYLRTDDGRRSQEAFRQWEGVTPSQPQGGYRPGMAQPVGPSDNGTPYGAGFVLGADRKPDFMFDNEWAVLQNERRANRKAAYEREYLNKYAPPPAPAQQPIEPYIVKQVGLSRMLLPNPEWGLRNGMTAFGGSWVPTSMFGGATGSMSDYFGGGIIPRLGQYSPYSAYWY